MKNKFYGVVIFIFGILGASHSFAYYSPKTQEIGIRGGILIFEGDAKLDNAGMVGISFGHFISQPLEIEVSLLGGGSQNSLSNQSLDVFLPTVEALYHFGDSELRPFLAAGGGILNLNYSGSNSDRLDFAIPLGGGVKWYFYPGLIARADFRYLMDTQSGLGTHNALISAGLSYLFGEVMEENPVVVTAPPPTDTDNDGVPDGQDACPGTPSGVTVDAQGCPRDSDGDGVSDDKDACPGTPAGTTVDANGCPHTPAAAPVPEKEWILEGVQFEKMSDSITPSSEESLNKAAETLLAYPTVRVEIEGHTDSSGVPAFNLNLSTKRAQAVKDYLVKKGVSADRMEVKGYGEGHPKYDNKTPEGRAKNRRIEFKVLSR